MESVNDRDTMEDIITLGQWSLQMCPALLSPALSWALLILSVRLHSFIKLFLFQNCSFHVSVSTLNVYTNLTYEWNCQQPERQVNPF